MIGAENLFLFPIKYLNKDFLICVIYNGTEVF